LEKPAFFLQGDFLLLPADFPDSQMDKGISIDFTGKFKKYDILELPAIDDAEPSTILAVSVSPEESPPVNWKKIPVRQVLAVLSAEGSRSDLFIKSGKILRAFHITQWRRESRFCGTCGAENTDISCIDAHRRCPKCGRLEYPRICPAVIVIITDENNRILLAHNKKFKAGVYSHISGFNEAGETLEAAVKREIREEVNIEVKNITYITSQPWPFPNSLMLGFKACYSSGVIRPDGAEIEDAKWFTKDNLPELPGEGSLSRFMINDWLNG